MILVLLGTTKIPFERPLKKIEKLVKNSELEEEIIVQSGFTDFRSDCSLIKINAFFSRDELDSLYEKARVIISHGGTGSVVTGLKKRKKIIVIPRLKKFNEHVDNHQLELVRYFTQKGYVIPWYPQDDLLSLLTQVESFKPQMYDSDKEKIVNYLANYIDSI